MGSELGVCSASIAPVTGLILENMCVECAPIRWDEQGRWIIYDYAEPNPVCHQWSEKGDLIGRVVKPGDVNCRDVRMLSEETEGDRCLALGTASHMDNIASVLTLNPGLKGDCSNIKYNTPYCIRGFIEPLHAHNGKCGPLHNNATCRWVSHGQCCNSETWTCGRSEQDCAPGTCYEGKCWVYVRIAEMRKARSLVRMHPAPTIFSLS